MSLSDWLSTITIIMTLGGTVALVICTCMTCYHWLSHRTWGPHQ